ncbi:MAG: VWA domain-containing protein [candidate division NC10 bacterium]|nr:VWA domain-containing protein [candidate division NC10 bacterium]
MTFLSPAAFLLLLTIPVVILFHLLKIRRQQALVSSTLLWGESLRDQQASAPFRRLKPNLLLLLQILALLALAMALARPVRTILATGYERNVFILDVSASMQARDLPGSRFTAAKHAALAELERLRPGQQAMVIVSGHEPRVLVPFTEEQRVLRQAVQALEPLDVEGELSGAFRLAQANLQPAGRPAVIHAFTDGAFDAPSVPDVGGAAIRWHRFAQRSRNIGITAFETRKTYFGAYDYQAFLSVANYGSEAATFDLTLTLDGTLLKAERVTLGPEVKRSLLIPFTHNGGGILRAEINVEDDLRVDNRALAVLPPPRPLRALLISGGNAFLEKALSADPQIQVEAGTLDSLAKAAQYDVVILDSVPAKTVPAGRYLFINTLPEGIPLELLGRVDEPPIIDWDRTHPVMRYLDLSKVAVQEAMRVRPVGSGRALVESNLTPLIYALDERRVKAVFVGFDLYRTDFPLRVAFPLFVSHALRWLYPSQIEDAGLQLRAGQPLMASLPAGVREATLTDPAGKGRTLRADADGRVSFVDTARAGVYTLRAGTWEQRFAVNLLSDGESNVAPRAQALVREERTRGAPEEEAAAFPSRQELWRLFALLGLLLLCLEGALYHRQAQGSWPLGAAVLRGIVVLLLLLGLFGAGLYHTTDQLNVLFLLDASDSVSLENRVKAWQYVEEAVKAAGKRDRYGAVAFGGSPALETPLGSGPLSEKPPGVADSRATDIGGAIKLALAAFPREGAKRIVLLTDGNENQGSAREAAQRAQAEGADIHVVPLRNEYAGEVLVERLVIPQEVKFGESFLVRVVAWSAKETSGRISLYRDGEFVGAQPVKLTPGKNVFAYQQSIDQGGFHVFQARLEAPDDVVEENNRGVGLVAVRGRPQVLYVEKDRDQGTHLLNALRTQNLQVEMVGPEALPASMEGLTRYDSIILSNVSALRMTKPQMELLRNYVRDQGGGLVMLGGEESFGVGGYYHTAIEEALPVTMEARQKVEIPSLAAVLVIDRSGSMETSVDSRFSKLDLAKEAAQLVVELLDERNEVGVIAFDTAWSWVVPMGPAKDKDRILKEIATIKAGGGTDLFPPLKEAYQAIYDRQALLRHVLVLSDGEVTVADFAGLVRRMQKDKITVSSVAIGKDSDVRFMTDLSRWGRGRFYYTEDVYSIPRILTLETQLASKASIIEQPFRPVLSHAGHEIAQDVRWDQVPPLGGYVSTTPKPTADTILISHQRDPILAAWRFGLGRTVAFTSDAKAKWGILWVKWGEFAKLFGQTVRWTLRTAQRNEVVTSVVQRGGRGEVQLEAVDARGEFVNFLEANAGVVYPDKTQGVLPLVQVGPGRYRGAFPAAEQGAYLVGVAERKDQKMVGSEVASLVVPYSPEHRALSVNEGLLRDLATLTGGAAPSQPGQSFTQNRRKARVWVEAWPYLLGLALLLFLPDVAVRRLQLRGRLWRSLSARSGPRPTGPGGAAGGAEGDAAEHVAARFGGRGRRT